MATEITIVTAFFNIGRENMQHFKRSAATYFDYFSKWAKMKNEMVVFVDNESVQHDVLSYREAIGLREKTRVVLIQDVSSLEPEVLDCINTAVCNETYLQYRLRPKNPESYNAMYNYIMALKGWCIDYTARELGYKGQLAWMDFGFNHGGQVFSLDSDFNITWEYDFGDKITFFNLKPLDNRPIFDIVFSMDTYIMGSIIIVPAHLSEIFWKMTKESIFCMSKMGISDDDQVLWLMNYRANPDLCSIKSVTDWHTALKEYGCENLEYMPSPKELLLKRMLRHVRHLLECLSYAKRIFQVAEKWKQR